jgi:hypothetical protein
MNSTYVGAQASRAIAGRFVARKNRKERCKQFSEKRTSVFYLPKVTFPDVNASNYATQDHPVVEVRQEKKIVEVIKNV